MKLFKEIKKSIYGPAYYKSLIEKPLSYSIKYFLKVTACLAVFSAVVLLFSILPTVHSFLTSASERIVNYYPSDLKILITRDAEVQKMLRHDGLTEEEIFLVIQAGAILAGDWAFYDSDELPTKPDHGTIMRLAKTM